SRESLFTILKSYTIRHPGKGYCQGQAPLAAVLLMFMPEVEAFWAFNEICERYLVSYYDEGLELIQIDGQVLYGLLKRLSPQIHKFLASKIIIFKVGLLLLYRCFGSASFRKSCGGIDDILMRAQTVPSNLTNPEELVRDVSSGVENTSRDIEQVGYNRAFSPLVLGAADSHRQAPGCP
ncbi:unnamed protein product, partial [Mesocestoides corti]